MNSNKHSIKSRVCAWSARLGALCALLTGTVSCSMVNEDMDPCPQGVSLRFVYDYNMERANAFPSQVDCVTLYIFDRNGSLIEKHIETSEVLSDENYRMTLDLGPGDYHFLALGGSTCEKNSFEVAEMETRAERADMFMRLPLNEERRSSNRLHDLFYGELQNIHVPKDELTNLTLYMMKDTNSVQVTLQELESPYSVDVNDYEFRLEADNELLGHDNATISTGGIEYLPHTAENRTAGYVSTTGNVVDPDESQLVQIGVSEFHISRLMLENSEKSYIVVSKKGSGEELIRVPMIDYMLMARHVGQDWIQSDQEYLDRQSTWSFMFFLQNGKWFQARVAVNNWILRFNHATI